MNNWRENLRLRLLWARDDVRRWIPEIIFPRVEQLRFKFEPRDLWVGVFWDRVNKFRFRDIGGHWEWEVYHIYITIIPTVPLFIEVWFPLEFGPGKEKP